MIDAAVAQTIAMQFRDSETTIKTTFAVWRGVGIGGRAEIVSKCFLLLGNTMTKMLEKCKFDC